MRLVGVVSLIALQACSACSSEPTPVRPDASHDASDGAVDVQNEAAPCAPKARPAFVPDGWVEWNGYAPCAGFYVPTSETQLPAPVKWEDCPSEATPKVQGCRSIALDPAGTGGSGLDVALDALGKPVLTFGQDYATHQIYRVAHADGAVHSSILASDVKNYSLLHAGIRSVAGAHWAFGVMVSLKTANGVIVGSTNNPAPTAGRRWSTSVGNSIGGPGLANMTSTAAIDLLSADDPSEKLGTIITPAQTGTIGNSGPVFFGSSLFWFGNANRRAIQRRWDDDTGPVEFIDYNDDDHGAGNLGTDGVDMVWIESHGPATKDAFWTTADYWTSPYAKNKADLKPRRLRSEIPNALVGDAVVVGCGRAAFFPSNGLRIINLKDGTSWFLPEPANGWNWSTALALTCDEVFVRTASAKGSTISRLPIANLGPATTAD
ncbi:hypothetical protein BH09MYX1_BH09MYX1_61800 [soil metagenome]